MEKINIYCITVILLLSLSSPVLAVKTCRVYDNFSSSTLNATKWAVVPEFSTSTSLSENFLDTINQNYHHAQTFGQDAGNGLLI